MNPFKRFKLPLLVLLLSEILLLLLFPPSLLFKAGITAGGDTPSHLLAAVGMQEKILTPFSPVSWVYGAYAGFPLFLHYFPLPFMIMALLSLGMSILIAFKLVTLLAVIPVPFAVYYALRRLGSSEWVPAIGAALSLAFLFMTENSMWGGNICSTLAGEFSFGIAFVLFIVYTGRLYSDVPGRKSLFSNALIEALMALSSGYPLLQAGFGTSYFVLRGRNFRYLFLLHAAAFGLAGFWLLPLLVRVPWDTPFTHAWSFKGWTEFAPPVLWPAIVGALVAIGWTAKRRFSSDVLLGPEFYLFWQFSVALAGFALAPSVGLVDIRFLPFAQIIVVMLGAIGWGRIFEKLPRPAVWSALFCIAVAAFALTKTVPIETWIEWNYSGFESKPLWKVYRQVNGYLEGDENSPRVVYEHNETTNDVGSVRAFEMLPYFSGRSTLEGLYMQSSATAPFVFYMQSELTQTPSCVFSAYYYSRPDVDAAAQRLRLFNTNQVIAASENICNALDASPNYELQAVFPPYRIYRVSEAPDSYVEPLRYRPFRIPSAGWKQVQFAWFRKSSLHVPLIVSDKNSPGDYWKTLPLYEGPPENIPETPMPEAADVRAQATLDDGSMTIATTKPGHPLWIKVSYHPDWKITEGEGELYQASPDFMVLVPKSQKVVLTFDTQSGIYLAAKALTFLTVGLFLFGAVMRRRKKASQQAEPSPAGMRIPPGVRFLSAGLILAALLIVSLSYRNHSDPVLLYEYGLNRFNAANEKAQEAEPGRPETKPPLDPALARGLAAPFDECIKKFGHSSILDHCVYYKAWLLADGNKWQEVRALVEPYLKENPDSRIHIACNLMLGRALLDAGDTANAEKHLRDAALEWPEDLLTKQAGIQLAQITGAEPLLEEAEKYFQSGELTRAYLLFRALTFHSDAEIKARATLDLANCSYSMRRWEEATNLYLQWLNDHFDDPESPKVQRELRKCRAIQKIEKSMLEEEAPAPQSPGWLLRLLKPEK